MCARHRRRQDQRLRAACVPGLALNDAIRVRVTSTTEAQFQADVTALGIARC